MSSLSPQCLAQTFNLARQHHQAGRLKEAEQLYRQVLGQNPQHADSLHLLGVLASQVGHKEMALELITRSITLRPNQAEYYGNLGLVLAELKRLDQAITAYCRAISLKPDFAQAHNNLGNALADKGEFQQAIISLRQAAALQPGYADAHYNMGNTFKEMGQLAEAVDCYRRALARRPGWREAENNLGTVLSMQGQFDLAQQVYQTALAARPGDPLAHWNVGLGLLRAGKLESAWPEYEWRGRVSELGMTAPRLSQQRWDGTALNGKKIYIHAEQGFGDTLQFIRYVPEIVRRGGVVIVGSQPELAALLKPMNGVEQVVTSGDALPDFDVYCPLPSLPAVLGTTLATIPAPIPYLFADEEKKRHWQGRLSGISNRKVGLCWAGRPTHGQDRYRSLALKQLAPLAQERKVRLISLQKSEQARQSESAGFDITDWTHDLHDFADTAALIDNLDLVITVDTAVAHLAGAMGKRVWVLLACVADWRWMLDRTDSPWYPTLRLFRQHRHDQWQETIAQVAEAISNDES